MRRYLAVLTLGIGIVIGYLIPHPAEKDTNLPRTPWAEFMVDTFREVPSGDGKESTTRSIALGTGNYETFGDRKVVSQWFARAESDEGDAGVNIYISDLLSDRHSGEFGSLKDRGWYMTRTSGIAGLPVSTVIHFDDWRKSACGNSKSSCDKKAAIDYFVAELRQLPTPISLSVVEYLK